MSGEKPKYESGNILIKCEGCHYPNIISMNAFAVEASNGVKCERCHKVVIPKHDAPEMIMRLGQQFKDDNRTFDLRVELTYAKLMQTLNALLKDPEVIKVLREREKDADERDRVLGVRVLSAKCKHCGTYAFFTPQKPDLFCKKCNQQIL